MNSGAHGPGADVLLAHSQFVALDPKQSAKARPYPPLGTLYAAAALRREGWSVALYDATLEPGPETFPSVLEVVRPRVIVLFEDGYNFYVKMCLGAMRSAALDMIRAASIRGLPVLVAGPDVTDAPAAYLGAGATAVMSGEAERTVAEALGRLLSSSRPAAVDLSEVAGLVLPGLRRDGQGSVSRTAKRPPERDPASFGLPARDLVDLRAYRSIWRSAHGGWSLNMASTRGCPFKCNWCAKPIWGQRYVARSPESVAAELADLRRDHAPDHVWFADDIFGLRPGWIAEFGRTVAEAGGGVPFTVQTRVDLLDGQAVSGLAAAGCEQVWLGVESGAQSVVDAMDKGIRVSEVPGTVARLRAAGIKVGMFLQLGYPGEGWREILATADLVRGTLPDEIGVSVSYPLPGTAFHARVAAQLRDDDRWRDSRDLAMLFEGAFDTDFYRRLHSLLHEELEARRGLLSAERSGDSGAEAVERDRIAGIESAWRELAESREDHRRARSRRPLPRAVTPMSAMPLAVD